MLTLKNNFVLILWCLKNKNFYINVEIITVFQCRNNVSVKLTSKFDFNVDFGLTIKTCLFLCYKA